MPKILNLYVYICIFRLWNALLIQSQFDPDEYWQTLEPAYCQVFRPTEKDANGIPSCEGLTWEWKRRAAQQQQQQPHQKKQQRQGQQHARQSSPPESSSFTATLSEWIHQCLEGPVRSYASVLPTYLFYQALKFFNWDTTWMVSKGPVLIHAVLVAAPTDLAVWYMAHFMTSGGDHDRSAMTATATTLPGWCLFCSIVSWFNGYALIRTYTNSVETVLLALGMTLVSPELLSNAQLPSSSSFFGSGIRSCLAFLLGGISSAIRFTSLAAYVPMGILLASQQVSILAAIRFLFVNCALFGVMGIGLTLLVDRVFYGFWCIPFLGNFHFNVLLGHGRLYGTHPFHWYLTAGIPAITGLLLPFLLLALWRVLWGREKSSNSCRNLWIIILCYAVAHSFSAHKEFRFLLPILPVFCLLAGQGVQDALTIAGKNASRTQNKVEPKMRWWPIMIFALSNLTPVLYLGLVHQRAPIDVNQHIVRLVPPKHHPQTYMIHYLMGCHSTPLLSHLHHPPIKFETWYLDCSPSCRSDPSAICQSDSFSRDPGQFMEQTYFHCDDFEEGTCVTDLRIMFPDFVVTFAEHVPFMKSRLSSMGLFEVGRFTHGINGLRVRLSNDHVIELGKDNFSSGTFSVVPVITGKVELSLDEMVLFASRVL